LTDVELGAYVTAMAFLALLHRIRPVAGRPMWLTRASSSLNRPSPPPLPREQQREFEELQRAAQTPAANTSLNAEADLGMHPDARKPTRPDFEGDVNPVTGEQGGPKREPIRKWGENPDGDWSFNGRVTDF
jgi:hypothetical protein